MSGPSSAHSLPFLHLSFFYLPFDALWLTHSPLIYCLGHWPMFDHCNGQRSKNKSKQCIEVKAREESGERTEFASFDVMRILRPVLPSIHLASSSSYSIAIANCFSTNAQQQEQKKQQTVGKKESLGIECSIGKKKQANLLQTVGIKWHREMRFFFSSSSYFDPYRRGVRGGKGPDSEGETLYIGVAIGHFSLVIRSPLPLPDALSLWIFPSLCQCRCHSFSRRGLSSDQASWHWHTH